MKSFAIVAAVALTGLSAKADSPPGIEWQRSFGGSDNDYLASIQELSGGGYLLGGYSFSAASGNKTSVSYGSYDYWLIRIDADGNKLWEKTFGGSGDDKLSSVRLTSDGGCILGGSSSSGISGNRTSVGNGGYDCWILRLDSDGNKIWEKAFGGDSDDYLFSQVIPTADGGYIFGATSLSGATGNKISTNHGIYDYWVVKLDANGNRVWDASFGGDGYDEMYSIHQAGDGGYILGGLSTSGSSGNKTSVQHGLADYWVVKLGVSGNKLWEVSFGGTGNDYLYSLHQSSGGGFVIGGMSSSAVSGNKTSANHGGADFWVLRLDGLGAKVWENSFGGNADDQLYSLAETADGGFVLGGRSSSPVSGNKSSAGYGVSDFWVVKLDSAGGKVWDVSFGGSSFDYLNTIQQTADGGCLLGGYSASGISGNKTTPSFGGHDVWIIKLQAPPRIRNLTAAGSQISFTWNAVAGQIYRVEYKNDLGDANWTPLVDVTANGSIASFSGAAGNARRFYRVVLVE